MIVKLLLEKLKAANKREVTVVCREDNRPSIRIIAGVGGKLKRRLNKNRLEYSIRI